MQILESQPSCLNFRKYCDTLNAFLELRHDDDDNDYEMRTEPDVPNCVTATCRKRKLWKITRRNTTGKTIRTGKVDIPTNIINSYLMLLNTINIINININFVCYRFKFIAN